MMHTIIEMITSATWKILIFILFLKLKINFFKTWFKFDMKINDILFEN